MPLFLSLVVIFATLSAQAKEISSTRALYLSDTKFDAAGESQIKTFKVSKNAIGFQINILGDRDSYLVSYLESPKGEVFVSDEPQGVVISKVEREKEPAVGQMLSPNRSLPGIFHGTGTLLFPNSDNLKVSMGDWKFRIRAFGKPAGEPEITNVTIVVKELGDGEVAYAVLPIYTHFKISGGFSPEGKNTTEVLASASEVFKALGIRFKVQKSDNFEEDISANYFPEKFFRKEKESDGIHIYFGDQQLPNSICGISANLPGMTLMNSPVRTGVYLTSKVPDHSNQDIGHILSHEIGHQLGLFHVSERYFVNETVLKDNISDTHKGNEDRFNVMYPDTLMPEPHFTAGQAIVLLKNPLLKLFDNSN